MPDEPGEDAVPSFLLGELGEIAPGVWLLPGFGNTTIIVGSAGVAVVDPGLFINGPRVVRTLRQVTQAPVRYVVYTHGHYDHAFGTPALLDEARARGDDVPDIVGHVNVARRFDRYERTSGHLALTYDMQFASWGAGGGDVVRNARYFPPTLSFQDAISLDLGDLTLACRHGLGETDDHTWVWIPERRIIVGGDFIVSSIPNAGTPFRVQRYVIEWAEVLEEMAALEPTAVISGHGGVFAGDATEMLLTTAAACRWLDSEVVRRLNEGQWGEQILHEVQLPPDLDQSRYLRPLYGCTSFVVRDILRRYKGWYDGNPSMLFPSPTAMLASEIVGLVGGVDPILERIEVLASSPDVDAVQLALHLLDLVVFDGGSKSEQAKQRKADLLDVRARFEPSFVAQNVLKSAAAIERGQL
ncbi:MAG TPA: alkyl sulfatase dimerization domain-containing protein [Acidimicrobiales bacterium]|nr:alkyl sulfatase dimerization domain-containing protein [Acidimicrobiales bacterium]